MLIVSEGQIITSGIKICKYDHNNDICIQLSRITDSFQQGEYSDKNTLKYLKNMYKMTHWKNDTISMIHDNIDKYTFHLSMIRIVQT